MKFKMNDRIYKIKFVEQRDMFSASNEVNELKGNYFGKFFPYEQEIWLSNDLSYEQSIYTLIHELTHCYIWTYCTNTEHFIEEDVCNINSNSFLKIAEIIKRYQNELIWNKKNHVKCN